MPNAIEKKAQDIVVKELREKGHEVKKSDNRTFDLIVDGKYVEVKGKGKEYDRLDFISLTENQYKAIKDRDFDIYVVCGINDNQYQIYVFNAKLLIGKKHREVKSYEYDKSVIDMIK